MLPEQNPDRATGPGTLTDPAPGASPGPSALPCPVPGAPRDLPSAPGPDLASAQPSAPTGTPTGPARAPRRKAGKRAPGAPWETGPALDKLRATDPAKLGAHFTPSAGNAPHATTYPDFGRKLFALRGAGTMTRRSVCNHGRWADYPSKVVTVMRENEAVQCGQCMLAASVWFRDEPKTPATAQRMKRAYTEVQKRLAQLPVLNESLHVRFVESPWARMFAGLLPLDVWTAPQLHKLASGKSLPVRVYPKRDRRVDDLRSTSEHDLFDPSYCTGPVFMPSAAHEFMENWYANLRESVTLLDVVSMATIATVNASRGA